MKHLFFFLAITFLFTQISTAETVLNTPESQDFTNIQANNPVVVTIGEGTSSSAARGPIQQGGGTTTTRYSRFNLVYSQAEMVAAGVTANSTISELRWFLNTTDIIQGSGNAPLKIFIQNSSANDATPVSWDDLTGGLTPVVDRVFNTTDNFPGETGWMPFIFNTPFVYSGGAIEISVEWDFGSISIPAFTGDDSSNPNGQSIRWRWSVYPNNVVVRALSSSGYSNNLTFSTGSARPNERANIQMVVTEGVVLEDPMECIFDRTVNDLDIISNRYNASNKINSEGIVQGNSDVTFAAGMCISLGSDFEVTPGAIFHAFIEDCSDNGGNPGGGLDPNLEPWENFDLTDWSIDTPAPRPSDMCRAVRSDEDEWDEFRSSTSSPYFFTHSDGGMRFVSPVGGATTNSSCNSGFPRCELREMLRRGDTSVSTTGVNANNWALGYQPGGTNHGARNGVLTASLRVNEVTSTGDGLHPGRTIIGQIHADNDEPARLYYRKLPNAEFGCVYLEHEIRDGNCVTFNLIGNEQCSGNGPADGIRLNELFSYEIINQGALLTVRVRRGEISGTVIAETTINMDTQNSGYDIASEWMYFKAGAYTQNNTGDDDDRDVITFYHLANGHDAN